MDFVFEAENMNLTGGSVDTGSAANSNASGMKWVGGISINSSVTLSLLFNSDCVADVTMYIAFSGAADYNVAFNSAFTLTLNGEPVTPPETAQLYGGNGAYYYFRLNEIAKFTVKEGENTLVLTHVPGIQAGNIDYFSFATEAKLT